MKVAVLGAGTIVPGFLEAAAEIPELEIYAIWGAGKQPGAHDKI
jgi:hypothetical protein